MYGVDYWINVGKMALFLIVALLLGLAQIKYCHTGHQIFRDP